MPSRPAQSTRRIVVALDGPASSGKSSVGAAAAEQLQLRFVDTGLFYRALTALALLEGVELDDPAAIVPLVDRVSLGDDGSGRFTRVLLDGSDATEEARSALVDGSVSTVARVPEVRAALLERQRELAADGGIVMAGRDVGTVVLPDADLKLFLDASVEERSRRRIEERGLDPEGAEAEEVREQLRARDAIDTGREVAPLRAADDAVHVLTDGNAFDETVEIVAAEIAGVMLTPRPRTRTRKAPAAPVNAAEPVEVAEEAVAPDVAEAPESEAIEVAEAAVTPEAPEAEAAVPKPTRTRTRKVAGAAAIVAAEPKPKRVRKPKVAPEPAAESPDVSEPEPTPDIAPEAPEIDPAAAPEIEAEVTALETAPEPELSPAPAAARAPTQTKRAQARARSTARKAAIASAASGEPTAVGDADVEPAEDSTPQAEEPTNLGQDSSQHDETGVDAAVAGEEQGPYATSEDEEDTSDAAGSYSEGDEATALAGEPDRVHTPTHRSQARARATARRAALASAAASEAQTDAEPRPQPAAKPAHTPTRRSEARSRATARRAAVAAAASDGDAAAEAEPEPADGPEQAAKPAHAPTRRAQARSRATARRAAIAATAASHESEPADQEAEPTPELEAAKPAHTPTRRSQERARATARRAALAAAAATALEAEPRSEPEPATPAPTPTKRSQARARTTARRAALAAATSDAEAPPTSGAEPVPEPALEPQSDSGSESEPGPAAAPDPQPQPEAASQPEPEPAPALPIAAATAAAAAATPRAPRPAAKPRERDPILEAAMQLDNDPSMMIRMIALVARIGSRLFADVEVTGLDHIPRRGAVILAVNHISNADPVVVGAWVTDTLKRRRIHWLGKRELFAWPVLGWVAAHGGIHPVNRDSADVEAYRLATKILENGFVLLVFPEGTRSPTGELQEAKDGVAMLALRTGAQIVPIGVSNTDAVWRKGRALPLPFPRRRVTVRVGTPFRVQDVLPAGVDRREAKSLATTEIMGRIAALLDPRHRGVYAGAVREERPPRG